MLNIAYTDYCDFYKYSVITRRLLRKHTDVHQMILEQLYTDFQERLTLCLEFAKNIRRYDFGRAFFRGCPCAHPSLFLRTYVTGRSTKRPVDSVVYDREMSVCYSCSMENILPCPSRSPVTPCRFPPRDEFVGCPILSPPLGHGSSNSCIYFLDHETVTVSPKARIRGGVSPGW